METFRGNQEAAHQVDDRLRKHELSRKSSRRIQREAVVNRKIVHQRYLDYQRDQIVAVKGSGNALRQATALTIEFYEPNRDKQLYYEKGKRQMSTEMAIHL